MNWNPHHVIDWVLAALAPALWLWLYLTRGRRMLPTKPPSTPQELEDDALATDGYVVAPPGAPVAPSGRWPTPSGVPVGGTESVEPGTVNGVPPLHPPVRRAADAPDFVVPGVRTAERITCEACGAGWWFTATQMHTGVRKAERALGEAPIYICAHCHAVYQEVAPNTFERIRFDENGRLTR